MNGSSRISDTPQAVAYWTAFVASVVLISAGVVRLSTSLAVLGVLVLLVLLIGNPAFMLLRDGLATVRDCGPALKEFVGGLGSKLGGKVSPELSAAVKSINAAHENDKAIDNRLAAIEAQVSALKVVHSMRESRREADDVSGIVG